MKYYVYISDAKVDMLLPQIADDEKKKIAVDFKIDLKLLSASWKSEKEDINDRIKRLDAICRFIRNFGNVGTIDKPDEWVEGTLLMSWLVIPESHLVYLTTTKNSDSPTIVGLGGSERHIVGNSVPSNMSSGSRSLLWEILKELNQHFVQMQGGELEHPVDQPLYLVKDISERVDHLQSLYSRILRDDVDQLNYRFIPPVQQKVEFLAKRLSYGIVKPRVWEAEEIEHSVLIATPIYIALAE